MSVGPNRSSAVEIDCRPVHLHAHDPKRDADPDDSSFARIEGHDVDRLGRTGVGWRRPIRVRSKVTAVFVELNQRLLPRKARRHLLEIMCGVGRRGGPGLNVLREVVDPDSRHRDDAEHANDDNAEDDPDPRLDLPGPCSWAVCRRTPGSRVRASSTHVGSLPRSQRVSACFASLVAVARSPRLSARRPISTRARPLTHACESPPVAMVKSAIASAVRPSRARAAPRL